MGAEKGWWQSRWKYILSMTFSYIIILPAHQYFDGVIPQLNWTTDYEEGKEWVDGDNI